MTSAERDLITEVWAGAPSGLVRGSGAKPLEVESFLALDRLQEGENLPLLGILQTVYNSKNVFN